MSNNSVEVHASLTGAYTFPLARLAKTPAVKWQSFDGDLPAGTLGYGVDCGRSNFVVIDLDCHEEAANGLDSWRELLAANGGAMGDTFTVSTPNGGLHLYYRAPNDTAVRNSAGKLGPGIDVRGAGGYVVGPNSQIKTSDGLQGSYDVVRDEVISELPAWLLDLLTTAKDSPQTASPMTTSTDDFPDNYARKALEAAFYVVSIAPSGQRNETLNSEAYGAAKAGAPVDRVVNDLTHAALTAGLSRKEIDATVRRAATDGAKQYVPRALSAYSATGAITDAGGEMIFQKFTKEYYLDLPLGERWAKSKNGELLYVMESSKWFRYDDETGVWVEMSESSIREDAANWLRKEYNAVAIGGKDSQTRHAERCLLKSTVDNTIIMGRLHMLTSSSDLDQHKEFLVVANGVVDLRTSELKPFDRSLLMTKRVAYPYDPAVRSKYWSKVLEALPEDAHAWLQVMTGQTLTGYQSASDVCLFLFGGGSNGKSTFLDIMAASAGTYGDEPPQSSLMRKTGHGEDFGLIEFKGIRQALVEELPDERNLDVKAIKKLVGTKNLTARGLYRGYETFEVQATLWVSCNRLPNVSETDYGTWRRLLVVPFPYTYQPTRADVTEDCHKLADRDVKKHASTDTATITACLAWRVAGAKLWHADRNLESEIPASVKEASLTWRKRSDHVIAWIDEMLVADNTQFCLSADLRDNFNLWLRNNGYSSWGAKLFLERFETSSFFEENKLVYTARGTVPHSVRQSLWQSPDSYSARMAGKQPAHVLGVRFRTDADDSSAVAEDTQHDPDSIDEDYDDELFGPSEDETDF